VLIRTDMDGLPVTEQTGLPYASKVRTKDRFGNDVGVMHACGHDIHMANLVGAARWLDDHRGRWSGTVVLVGCDEHVQLLTLARREDPQRLAERLAPEGDAGPRSRASKYLLWTGTALFWSLVGAIVVARAVFFEPGVFDDFSRVATLVKAAIF